jgi:hypothetical protein
LLSTALTRLLIFLGCDSAGVRLDNPDLTNAVPKPKAVTLQGVPLDSSSPRRTAVGKLEESANPSNGGHTQPVADFINTIGSPTEVGRAKQHVGLTPKNRALAQMLDVHRPTVSVAAAMLQKAGVLDYRRGEMTSGGLQLLPDHGQT